jgi:hypothetical protein
MPKTNSVRIDNQHPKNPEMIAIDDAIPNTTPNRASLPNLLRLNPSHSGLHILSQVNQITGKWPPNACKDCNQYQYDVLDHVSKI